MAHIYLDGSKARMFSQRIQEQISRNGFVNFDTDELDKPEEKEPKRKRLTLSEYRSLGPSEIARRCLHDKNVYADVMELVRRKLI